MARPRKTTKSTRSTRTTKSPRKTSSKRGPKSSSKSKEVLFVASKTKEILKSYGLNVASDALEGLNDQIHYLLDQAAKRTTANKRQTVRNHDFFAR